MLVNVSRRNCRRGTLVSGAKVVWVSYSELKKLLHSPQVRSCEHCAAYDGPGHGNNGRVCREGAGIQCCTVPVQSDDGCWVTVYRYKRAVRLHNQITEIERAALKARARYDKAAARLLQPGRRK